MGDANKHRTGVPEFDDPVTAIRFYMAERSLQQRDLVPMIGSRSKVSEVLSGTRPLTMPMARALHRHLGIPAEALLKEPAIPFAAPENGLDWRRFPLNEMVKRGWVSKRDNLRDKAEELVTELMQKAGYTKPPVALYRKTDRNRANAKTDPYALQAWCWQVLAQANEREMSVNYRRDKNQAELMRQVARFSPASDGPRQAVAFLAEQGIAVAVVRHLPRTHLDGAAMKSANGSPVIGLTLRYDRIDNFWWVLMHELAHVVQHLPETDETFIDDLSLASADDREADADTFARNGLVPAEVLQDSGVLANPSPMAVIALAQEVGIHPAIVAGSIRYKLGNYRLLSQFVGTGEVRRLFQH